ncbi:MAG: ABC transporter permease [Actinomycetota bacterium]
MTDTISPSTTATTTDFSPDANRSTSNETSEPMTSLLYADPTLDTTAGPASTETASPTTTPTRSTISAPSRFGFGRLVSAEWLKFRTVRSNLIALLGAAVAAIGFGTLFASLADSDDAPGRIASDGLSLSLGGFDLAQLIIAILGVALVAGEYQTGLIRSWFAAAPNRIQVLLAKVSVFTGAVFVVTAAAVTVAFLAGQAVLPDTVTALSLTDDGVLQALAGTAFYAACIAAMGVALGFLLRSTAAGAGVVVTVLMLAPLMISLLPSSIADPVGKVLPSNAADAITGLATPGTDVLSTGWGLAVLGAWVIGTVGAAALVVHRRDA